MKRLLSMLMVLIMVLSMVPTQAIALEVEDTEPPVVTGEPTPTEGPVSEDEVPPETTVPEEELPPETTVSEEELPPETTVPQDEVPPETTVPEEAPETEPTERICEEGCILVGEEEHLENGGECFVWIPCTATEGCEGPEGHEGECYGVALFAGETLPIHFFLASPGNITNPNGSYVNYYGPAGSSRDWDGGETVSGIKDTAAWSTMYTQTGIRNVTDESVITQYIASYPHGHTAASFKDFGSVTINGTTYYDTEYEIKWVSIMCRDNSLNNSGMRCQQTSFREEHIHVDGLLVKKVEPGQMEVYKTIPESGNTVMTFRFKLEKMLQSSLTAPPTSASAVDTSFAPLTLTATIPAGSTEAQITGGSQITFGYYKLTEISNQDWQMAGVALTNSRGQTQTVESDVLYICIAPNGTVQYSTTPSGSYSVMNRVEVQNERRPVTVTYEWKVYHTDGTFTELPTGAPNEPASAEGVKIGTRFVYDAEYVTGTSFYDYDKGLLYTFHGWDTYSHSDVYNPNPGTSYYALDDGDTNDANNPTIEITDDTYIYGYWSVTELTPSSAHIAIEKVFIVDGVEMTMKEAEDLWFRVDTGYDGDGDGYATIDVDYPMIRATGEYKIPVYQYDTPFVFTEYNAEVPGYTRTTTISVSGEYITGSSQSGDTVTVSMEPVYQGENIHLGTVTYVNNYTKNVGEAVSEYPVLTVMKSAADTGAAQDGAVFTLYGDEACTDVLTTVTTDNGGVASLDFADIEEPGTYYLKETAAPGGYHADPYVYAVTLAESQSVEELRNGEYVQVTYYTLSAAVPEGSTASFAAETNRLSIYDEPILGSLALKKDITGMDEAHESKLSAVVIVHGPISRDDSGNITDIGGTWQLELTSEESWAATLEKLPLGEYLIHESFASVHGYTWTGVTYGALETTVYNGITSGIFRVEDETPIELTLTNTYEEWAAADFYIKKVDDRGRALSGAVFTLSTDEAGLNVITTKTSGADGYAHFDGYTVPEGQNFVTYYLRETAAPQGYYLSDQVYMVVITAVTDETTGKVSFEPEISLVKGRASGFDIATDLLTVTNYPVLGEISITKDFENGLIPDGLTGVSVYISGPNGYSRNLELNNENGWAVTLEDLALGTYTISEQDANVPGYTWDVHYADTTVTLTEENPGKTQPGTKIAKDTTITNHYTRNEEIFEVPTALTVKKVGEQGEALAGAVFTLERQGDDGKTVSFTTGADGTVQFDLLYGAIEEGKPIEGTYILSETKAPEGYQKTDATWTVTIREDNGQIRWSLNENKNLFEGFWDWIVGNVSPGTFENGVLTVRNVRSLGSLNIQKNVTDPLGMYADAEYSFTLDCSDDAFDKTFTLKAGENITFRDIPWGTTYTLTEDTTGAAFTSRITDGGNGRIQANETRILVTNTYAYSTHNEPLSLIKVDGEDTTKVIPGAGFTLYADAELTTQVGEEVFSDENGRLKLPIEEAGTYYLAETTTPEGYHPNSLVYVVIAREQAVVLNAGTANAVTEIQMIIRIPTLTGTTENQIDYTYQVKNTAIKNLVVNVQKVWADEGYYDRPESVEVTLYRDEEVYETVTLNADNDWRYSWTSLTDEYTWTVDEKNVPEEYVKTVTNEGYDFTITNTRTAKPVEITVTKAWNHNGGKELPESITVTLYKNDEVYDTVVLNEENSWTYTWEGLNDASQWRVDETEVPAGYTKEVTVDGYEFTITNTRTINPVEISVQKVWDDEDYYNRPESVEVTLYRDEEAYETVTLNAGNDWSYSWTGLTDEYSWNVDEAEVPEEYVKTVTNEGYDFTITNTRTAKPVEITVTKAWNHNGGKELPESITVTLYKNDEVYDTVVLNEENSWTYTWEGLNDASQWRVDETEVPAGYTKEVTVDGYEFTITNTRTVNPVEVSVTKEWVASEGVIHPESVEAVLYRDGQEFATVTLSAENDWTYLWSGLTDEYTWTVDEKNVPEGYTKTVTNEGYDFTITNTKEFTVIDISVNKVWYGAGVDHPDSVEITLFRDGEAYDTVTLSAENDWAYTWEDLTDEYKWTVDELSVPSGYAKTVRKDGWNFTVVNTHVDNPKTGDFADLMGMGTMTTVGILGCVFCLLALFTPRRKREED
ncbi:MAG: Cna B-type domain-containing protein [Oscillospiraceae bacterium]|nr:Cna B-type domain-containing protein [Oscillospiraceae bacterium]